MIIPKEVEAAVWGLVSGSALVMGALIGYYAKVSSRVIASIMAFGSGVLIAALSFDLMEEAFQTGGFAATTIGFLAGASIFTIANWYISHQGAKHRKRSGDFQPSEEEHEGSGVALAVGALLDGIPESIVIGVSLIKGGFVSTVAVVAIFLSNIPEGLASSAGMRKAGRSKIYIFGIWITIALISSLSSFLGYSVFSHFSDEVIAAAISLAAGAILAMIADTMIPEAFAAAHNFTGIITVIGFLVAFYISKLSGSDGEGKKNTDKEIPKTEKTASAIPKIE